MTAKEKAKELYAAYQKQLIESGITMDDDRAYWQGYNDGMEAVMEKIKDSGLNLFPAYGDPVYKLVWTRQKISGGYLRSHGRNEHTTIITHDYALLHALENGTIEIEQRPFSKTDLLKIGLYVFETEEEAKAALDGYRERYGAHKK